MIVYGRNLSPFTRRVVVHCHLQERAFEQRALATAGDDFEQLKAVHPLGRVPMLTTDTGVTLIDSAAISDWLDETSSNGYRMIPASGDARRDALQSIALANGIADKAVALMYETVRRPAEYQWPDWIARLTAQIQEGLDLLETQAVMMLASGATQGASVMTVIVYQFLEKTKPELLGDRYPNLSALSAEASKDSVFAQTMP